MAGRGDEAGVRFRLWLCSFASVEESVMRRRQRIRRVDPVALVQPRKKTVAAEGINAVPELSSQRMHCNRRIFSEMIFNYVYIFDFREFGLHYLGY